MNPLTLREMELRRAQLNEKAERLRAQWRRLPATAEAIETGKEVKALQERADDYRDLIRMAAAAKP